MKEAVAGSFVDSFSTLALFSFILLIGLIFLLDSFLFSTSTPAFNFSSVDYLFFDYSFIVVSSEAFLKIFVFVISFFVKSLVFSSSAIFCITIIGVMRNTDNTKIKIDNI